jgi:hypothetical protein
MILENVLSCMRRERRSREDAKLFMGASRCESSHIKKLMAYVLDEIKCTVERFLKHSTPMLGEPKSALRRITDEHILWSDSKRYCRRSAVWRRCMGLTGIANWHEENEKRRIELLNRTCSPGIRAEMHSATERAKLLLLVWSRLRSTEHTCLGSLPMEIIIQIHTTVNALSVSL